MRKPKRVMEEATREEASRDEDRYPNTVASLMRATYKEVVAQYGVQGSQCIATAIIFELWRGDETQIIRTSSLYDPAVNNPTLSGLACCIHGLMYGGRTPVALLFAVDTDPVAVVVKYCPEYRGKKGLRYWISYDLDRFLHETIWDMNAIEYTYAEAEIPGCDLYHVRARDGDNL